MTDLPPKPATGQPATGRGLRIALAVSVALNLAVVGIVGGALLRPDGPRSHAMPRDLGFGVFTEALTPENRADLRRRLIRAAPGFVQERQGMLQDMDAIVTALRAEPFDRGLLDTALQAQIARLQSRLGVGQSLLLEFLSDLSTSERLAFADRLEAAASRHPPKPGEAGPGN